MQINIPLGIKLGIVELNKENKKQNARKSK